MAWFVGLAWVVPVLLCCECASAHEHWVGVDDFLPATGKVVNVTVCSGHYFPKSSFALKDKVLESVELLGPSGKITAVQTMPGEKERNGAISVQAEGVYILRCTLKRPRAKRPSYEAQTLLVTGNEGDDPARYSFGRGLEIVPTTSVSALKIGDELSMFVLLDGKRTAASLEVIVEGGKAFFLKTEPDRAAAITLKHAGRYLATTSVEGRGCSLLLQVGKPGEGNS